jgi:hypothetical protein
MQKEKKNSNLDQEIELVLRTKRLLNAEFTDNMTNLTAKIASVYKSSINSNVWVINE